MTKATSPIDGEPSIREIIAELASGAHIAILDGGGFELRRHGRRIGSHTLDYHLIREGWLDGIPNGSGYVLSSAGHRAYMRSADELGSGELVPPLPPGVRTPTLPPLPEPLVMVRDTEDKPEGGGWIVDCDCEGPLSYSLEAGQALYTSEQMVAYRNAGVPPTASADAILRELVAATDVGEQLNAELAAAADEREDRAWAAARAYVSGVLEVPKNG